MKSRIPKYCALLLALLFCNVQLSSGAALDRDAAASSPLPFMATSLIPDGTYVVSNHPDGSARPPTYCLRLDQLFGNYGTVTFDCSDHPDAHVEMTVTTTAGVSTVVIEGTVYGGRDQGTTYDPNNAGLWDLSFTYTGVVPVSGDDDLTAPPNTGSGTLTPQFNTSHFSAGTLYYLEDYNGQYAHSLQLGDKEDDTGHRGFNGISGWGWLQYGTDPQNLTRPDTGDWLFTVSPLCVNDPNTEPFWDGNIINLGGGLGALVLDAPNGLKDIALGQPSSNLALMQVEDMFGNVLTTFAGNDAINGTQHSGFGQFTYNGADGDAPTQVKLIIGAPDNGGSSFFLHFSDCCDRSLRVDPVLNLNPDDEEDAQLPATAELSGNYPNPFNPTTTISFTLPEAAEVQLQVLDMLGRVVRTLSTGTHSAGAYEAVWDGRDAAGNLVPSGVYFYRLEAGTLKQTRRMTLLK